MQKTFQRNISKKNSVKAILAALLAASLLLSGCGDSSGSSGRDAAGSATDADTLYFSSTEKAIPDPKTGFESNPGNQGKKYFPGMTDATFSESPYAEAKVILSPVNTYCADGKLYFLYSILYQMEDPEELAYTSSYCLAALQAPYEQWEYHIFSTDGLGADPAYSPGVQRILAADREGLYILLSDSLAFYGWDGNIRSLDEIELNTDPLYLYQLALYPVGEELYLISAGSVISCDRDYRPVLTRNLEHTICGCISRDQECLLVWL